MSVPIANQFGSPIPGFESLEAAENIRTLNKEFAERGKTADFGAGAKSMSDALGGIGKIDPKRGLEIAADVRTAEAQDGKDNDLDAILARLDEPEGGESELLHTVDYREVLETPEATEMIEHPYVMRLLNEETLSPEVTANILNGLLEGNTFEDAVRREENIGSELQQAIIDNWGLLNSKEGTQQFAQDFERDFGEQFSARQNGEFTSELMQSAYESVASAYMIGEANNNASQQKALNMAFGTAANREIFRKQFPKTELFERTMEEIANPDHSPDDRLAALTRLIALVNTDQGGKGKTVRDANARMRGQERQQHMGLTARYQEAQANLRIAQEQGDRVRAEALQREIASIEVEAKIAGTILGNFNTALEVGESETPSQMAA